MADIGARRVIFLNGPAFDCLVRAGTEQIFVGNDDHTIDLFIVLTKIATVFIPFFLITPNGERGIVLREYDEPLGVDLVYPFDVIDEPLESKYDLRRLSVPDVDGPVHTASGDVAAVQFDDLQDVVGMAVEYPQDLVRIGVPNLDTCVQRPCS
jgi:hypothetical protein